MLLRDLLAGRHREWRESMVLLIAPIYNADGNERVSLTNRGRQHGPIGGMGQRSNAQGHDLNRDHMKLDSPEARSVARLLSEYDPQVAIDLHTTNGTRHAYHITYSPPLHPNTPAEIDDFLRGGLFPHVTGEIRAKYGWEYHYYGNASGRGGGERGWYTFDHRPRFNNNYIGLRNRIAILSEAYAYATFEERVPQAYLVPAALEEVLSRLAAHGIALEPADVTPVDVEAFRIVVHNPCTPFWNSATISIQDYPKLIRETTYTGARRNLAALMDQVTDTHEPVLIRRRGKQPVALIAADDLSSWMETHYLLRSPKNAQMLKEAMARADAGEGVPLEVDQLRKQLGLTGE